MDRCSFDFVIIHDSHHRHRDFPGWMRVEMDQDYPFAPELYGHKQRYAKTMPHLYLADYSHSVYLDPKWELTESFLRFCREQVESDPGWLVATHPQRSTFFEEVIFPFVNGTLLYHECCKVVDTLSVEGVNFNDFYSTLCTWLIRRHDDHTRRIGERWFELIRKCYGGHVRDQIVFPFAVSTLADRLACAHVDTGLPFGSLATNGVRLNYPNQSRLRQRQWQLEIRDLIAYLHQRTGLLPSEQLPGWRV